MQLCILAQASLKAEFFPTLDLTPWGHWSLHNHFQDKGWHEYFSQRLPRLCDIFSKSKASKLADHWPYDLKITLDEALPCPTVWYTLCPRRNLPLYCAHHSLDRYSLHQARSIIFKMALCLYMWHCFLWTLAINTSGSSLLPSTLLPADFCFCLSKPLAVTSSAHPHQPSSITSAHQGWLTLQFLSFLREAVECDGKMRQWRFLMETRCTQRQ